MPAGGSGPFPFDPAAVVREFKAEWPTYKASAETVGQVIRRLFEPSSARIELIETRPKSVSSFAEKITRPGKSYTDPLRQITDLVGARVVVPSTADVEHAKRTITGASKI